MESCGGARGTATPGGLDLAAREQASYFKLGRRGGVVVVVMVEEQDPFLRLPPVLAGHYAIFGKSAQCRTSRITGGCKLSPIRASQRKCLHLPEMLSLFHTTRHCFPSALQLDAWIATCDVFPPSLGSEYHCIYKATQLRHFRCLFIAYLENIYS